MAGETLSIGEIEAVVAIKDQFSEVLKKAKEAIAELGPVFEGIAVVVGAVVAAIGLAVGAIVELGKHGSEVNDVSEGFDRLAGSTQHAADILDAMRKGVVGTIDDFNLMKDANKLLAVGAVKNADDFGTLTSAARVLSHEGFGPLPDIINGVSRAMETGATRRLALMGVTINVKDAEATYAAALGITADKLTDAEKLAAKRQAILDALAKTVKNAGDQELNFAEMMEKSKVTVQNFTNALAASVAQSPVLKTAMGAITDAISSAFGDNQVSLVKTITGYVNEFIILLVDLGIGATQVATVFVAAWGVLKTVVLGTETALVAFADTFFLIISRSAELASKLPGVGHAFDGVAASTKVMQSALDQTTAGLAHETAEAAKMITGHSELNASIDSVGGKLYVLRDKLIIASNAHEDVKKATTSLQGVNEDLADTIDTKTIAALDRMSSKEDEQLAATQKYFGGLLKETKMFVENFGMDSNGILFANQRGQKEENTFIGKLIAWPKTVASDSLLRGQQFTQDFGTTLNQGLQKTVDAIPNIFIHAFTGGGGISGAFKALGISLANDLAKPLETELQSAIGNALKPASAALGTVASAATSAGKSMAGVGTAAATSGIMTSLATAGMTAGIGLAVTGVTKLITAWFNHGAAARAANEAATAAIKKSEDALLQQYGSLDNIRNMSGNVGAALAAAWGDQNQAGLKHFNALLVEFQNEQAILQGAISEYSLTWQNLDDAHLPAAMATELADLTRKAGDLITAGYSYDAVIKAQAGSYSQLAQTAISTGHAMDASAYPVLQDLEKMGLLVDAAGNKLHVTLIDGVVGFSQLATAGLSAGGAITAGMQGAQGAVDGIANSISSATSALSSLQAASARYAPGGSGAVNGAGGMTLEQFLAANPGDEGRYEDAMKAVKGWDNNDPGSGQRGAATGGYVGYTGIQYMAGGNMKVASQDTVPAMLSPGEGVLSRSGIEALGKLNMGGNTGFVGPTHAGGALGSADIVRKLDELLTLLPRITQRAVTNAAKIANA